MQVDIFSPTDRLRIFHKSDVVRKLVNQRSADMAVTPLGGANHGSCSAKGKVFRLIGGVGVLANYVN